jgi:hypothetical protein
MFNVSKPIYVTSYVTVMSCSHIPIENTAVIDITLKWDGAGLSLIRHEAGRYLVCSTERLNVLLPEFRNEPGQRLAAGWTVRGPSIGGGHDYPLPS